MKGKARLVNWSPEGLNGQVELCSLLTVLDIRTGEWRSGLEEVKLAELFPTQTAGREGG